MEEKEFEDLKGNYEGYIWLSDQTQGILIDKDKCISSQMPIYNSNYISEALLTNGSESIHYTYTHRPVIENHKIPSDKNVTIVAKKYLPNRLGDKINFIKFNEIWEEKPDELCEGLMVLTKTKEIFSGFE